jgi:rubredoxin
MAENKPAIPENTWKCSNCGNTVVQTAPPQTCPVCKQACEFLNVTCYQPDCGFTGMDNRLKPSK